MEVNKRKLSGNLTEKFAEILHYQDNFDNLINSGFNEVVDNMNSAKDRYRTEPMFRNRVIMLVQVAMAELDHNTIFNEPPAPSPTSEGSAE